MWWLQCDSQKKYTSPCCRLPRSNAQTLWTLNWQLVTPRSDLGWTYTYLVPVCFPQEEGRYYVDVVRDGCCSGQNVSHELRTVNSPAYATVHMA